MKKNCCAIFFISTILLIAQPSNCFDADQDFFDSYHIYQGHETDETFGSDFVEALPTDPSELQTFFEALPTNPTELPTFFSGEDYEAQHLATLPPLPFEFIQADSDAPEYLFDQDTFRLADSAPLPLQKPPDILLNFDSTTQQPSTAAVTATSSLILSTSRKRRRPTTTYPCDHPGCTRIFTRISDLKRHLDIHNGIKRFACTFTGCTQSFARNDQLVIHMSSGHGRKKPHECPNCPNAFARKSDLTRHRAAAHEGIKRYACTVEGCAESFARNERLDVHMISAHGKEKPHKCPSCPNAYARKCDLNRHQAEAHEGIKPFACIFERCTKTFSRKSTRDAHALTFHKNQPLRYNNESGWIPITNKRQL